MRFFESGLVFVIFTALALPFRLSCTLEDFDACEEDGKLECDPLRGEQAYRKCSNLRWVEDKCPTPTFCEAEACVECVGEALECSEFYLRMLKVCRNGQWLTEDCPGDFECKQGECVEQIAACSENEKLCIDAHRARICVAGEKPTVVICGDKRHCEDGECIAESILCTDTSTTCFDEETIQLCEDGSYAILKACKQYDICESGQCSRNTLLCATTHDICIDDQMAEHCVINKLPVLEACGFESVCVENRCRPFSCDNGRFDAGEEAVDCGGPCEPCKLCRIHSDCETGFCDSAYGYHCSKRCRHDRDCKDNELWNGDFCRTDGRCSPKVFETEWVVPSSSLTIQFPYSASSSNAEICQFQVLWGDEPEGTLISNTPLITNCNDPSKLSHSYTKAGTYRVKVVGKLRYWGLFLRINMDMSDPDNWVLTEHAPKLRKVISFGPVGLNYYAFAACSELSEMPRHDIPNSDHLTDMRYFFYKNILFDASIGHWDTTNVNNMNSMFMDAENFNRDIGQWNTSSVLDMTQVFASAYLFNRPLGAWDTSNVTDMYGMFKEAVSFNQDVGQWTVSKVTSLEDIFLNARSFNQNINLWDTSLVVTMEQAFLGARSFNQPLDNWEVSKVKEMGEMFKQAVNFNQDISAWTLNAGVKLNAVFSGSGLSEANYCKLIKQGGQWLSQRAQLGVYESVTCP